MNYIKNILRHIVRHKKLAFEINIVDHCNLNCVCCDHFSPLVYENYTSIDRLESDLERLSLILNKKSSRIRLLGGEPLLHPQITEIIYLVRSFFPEASIEIITNGILLPKMGNEFFMACVKKDIAIKATKYPLNIDWKTIKCLCEVKGVHFGFFKYECNLMKKCNLNDKGTNNRIVSWLQCYKPNNCTLLKDGKLYQCSTCANSCYLNGKFNTKFVISSNDYLELKDITTKKQIDRFLTKPLDFCKYCNKDNIETVRWKKSNKDKDEWIN